MDWFTRISMRTLGRMPSAQPLVAPRFAMGAGVTAPANDTAGTDRLSPTGDTGETGLISTYPDGTRKQWNARHSERGHEHAPDSGAAFFTHDPDEAPESPDHLSGGDPTRAHINPGNSLMEDGSTRNYLFSAIRESGQMKPYPPSRLDVGEHTPEPGQAGDVPSRKGSTVSAISTSSSHETMHADGRTVPVISNLAGPDANPSKSGSFAQPRTLLASESPRPRTTTNGDTASFPLLTPDKGHRTAGDEIVPMRVPSPDTWTSPFNPETNDRNDRQNDTLLPETKGLATAPPLPQSFMGADRQRLSNPQAKPEPRIDITIGTIEVRAVSPAAPETHKQQRTQPKVQTLDQYLRNRSRKGSP